MRLAVIGIGKMGQALLKRWLAAEWIPADHITIYDKDEAAMTSFAAAYDVQTAVSPADAAGQADWVLLAVKPQVCPHVLQTLEAQWKPGQVLVSIAAGVTLSELRSRSGRHPAIVRVMPNLPAVIGQGVSALCHDQATADMMHTATAMFEVCGLALDVPESLFDAVTGLSGSGPAYVLLMIEALAEGAVAQGLSRQQALRMAAQTVQGAAALALQSEEHPAVLKDQITSPGGTTAAALAVLERHSVRAAMIDAVAAAAKRSKQLRADRPS